MKSLATQCIRCSALLLALIAPAHGQKFDDISILKAQARQIAHKERPASDLTGIISPSERVTGEPGSMRFAVSDCPITQDWQSRQPIVNAAVQEWAYFGATILDYTVDNSTSSNYRTSSRRRWSLLEPEQAALLSNSIAGYWSAAPESAWILRRQNQRWQNSGSSVRWRDPWSAAFISWVMCASGLGSSKDFARAVAHHTYIDQAIRTADGLESESAYKAYDIGTMPIVPGDMLCRGSRPAYRSIEERRQHLGVGARTHCDIVVKVTEEALMVIGGNVRGTVGMKLLPVQDYPGGVVVLRHTTAGGYSRI